MKQPERKRIFGFDRTYMFIFLLVIIVIGVAGYLMVMVNDYSYQAYTLNNELNNERSAHNETRIALENTSEMLDQTNNQLESQRIEINKLTLSFQTTVEEWNATKRELDGVKSDIANLRTELNYARAGGSFQLHNPTSSEMQAFLQNDSTSNNTYNETTYTCSYFSRDVKNNAESKGIRCAIVLLVFNQTLGHAMVGFDTTDKNFVYIEPQNDIQQNITKGGLYWGLEIRDILIIW